MTSSGRDSRTICCIALSTLALAHSSAYAQSATPAAMSRPSYAEVLATATAADWRALDAENTLYMEIPAGRIVIELSAAYAPAHAANIRTLVREGYFDGLAILRSQDNYVVQWGDPEAENTAPGKARAMKQGKKSLAPEYTVPLNPEAVFTRLPDVDGYAPEVGFSNGFPAARNPKTGRMWLTHCYGMVGAGRDNADSSGSGAELYVVNGHAPRHLDRNVTVLGRVVYGMTLLSVLPRGTGPLGFYQKAEQRVPIKSIRLAADVPVAERTNIEVIRTDTRLFTAIIESQRNRGGPWYKAPAGHIELCNVPIVTRVIGTTAN